MFFLNLVGSIVKVLFFGTILFWGVALGWFSSGFFRLVVAIVISVPVLGILYGIQGAFRAAAAEKVEAKKERDALRELEEEHFRLVRKEAAARRVADEAEPMLKRRAPTSVFGSRGR